MEQETITPAMFTHVADTEFAHVKRFTAALRSKNPRHLARYEDICEYDVDELVERTQSALGSTVAEGIRAAKASEPYLNEAIRNLLSTLPIDEPTARALVLEIAESKGVTSARMLTQAAIRLYAERTRDSAAA
jgi:protein subunit release factor A